MDLLWRIVLRLVDSGNGEYLTELNDVRVDCVVPAWMLPFLVLAATAVVFLGYYRCKRLNRRKLVILTVLRALVYALLLMVLVLPKLMIEGEGVPPGTIPVVVDATQSMTIRDVPGGERMTAARGIADQILEQSDALKDADVTVYRAGVAFTPYEPGKAVAPDGESTSLSGMLEQGIYDHLGAYCPGMILLSDGANNSSDALDNTLRSFRERGVQVYTCGIGTSRSTDLAVTYIVGEDVVFASEKAKVYVNVQQSGYRGQSVRIRLLMEDKEVYTGEHVLEADENSVPVEYQPAGKGVYRLVAVVEPLAGEVTEENNRFVRTVRVIDEQIRVLLVFGTPSWEYRYLAGAFERDKRVTFSAYMPSADSRLFRDSSQANHFITRLPEDATALGKRYDAVFISRIDVAELPRGFTAALPEFVESSGGLAVISDPIRIPHSMKNTVLEPLVPVSLGRGKGKTYRDELFAPVKDRLSFELTDDGMANQLVTFSGNREENKRIWERMPPVHMCYQGGRLKPSSISLLVAFKNRNSQEFPAIVHHAYGKGTVLFMGFDSTWRWRREFGDRYFREFWGKAVQFLGLPHLLNEAAQSGLFVGAENCLAGEKLNIRARVNNSDFSPYVGESVRLSVTSELGVRQIDMHAIAGRKGMYRADLTPESAGGIKLTLPSRFNARPVELIAMKQQREFRDSAMNRDLLQRIADETDAAYFDLEQADRLLPALMDSRPRIPISVRVSLWDTPLMLVLIVLLLGAEWVVRKQCYLD